MPEFKYDWFTPIRPTMERFVATESKFILEIGSFEGLSARFFCERCPEVLLTCVDHFKGGEDQQGLELVGLKERFLKNIDEYRTRIWLVEEDSWAAWHRMHTDFYDVIFVDGSHIAGDVLNDLCQAYRCAKPGGLILADDYSWENHRPDCPRVAIDAFIRCFAGRIAVLHIDRVAVMRKL